MDNKEFEAVLNDWLELFDKKYTIERIDISSRPFMATYEFINNAVSEIVNTTKEELFKTPYFGYCYNLVHEWFIRKYGSALKKKTGKDYIKSFIIINNMPYSIVIPKNIIIKKNDRESKLIFANNVHENENIFEWIFNPPNLNTYFKETIRNSIIEKADLLRNININLMTTYVGHSECDTMLLSILNQLESLAEDIVNTKNYIFSDSIWQTSLAVEKVLKVSIYSKSGNFKKIHDLNELVKDFMQYYPNITISPINYLPQGNESIKYRYASKTINDIETAAKVYMEALELINLVLSSIKKKFIMENMEIVINNPYFRG